MKWDEFSQEIKEKYDYSFFENIFSLLAGKKIMVIGETIIDCYQYVSPMSKSPKGNLIATHFQKEEQFSGGVLACANHIAEFCKKTKLVSCLGEIDSKIDFVLNNINFKIESKLFSRKGAQTTVNTRFVDVNNCHTKFFGVYKFEHSMFPEELEKEVFDFLSNELEKFDLVVVVDYGHGFFTEKIIDVICNKAKFLALNVQTNSTNYGFNVISKFSRADYVCLDELEALLAVRDRFADIEEVIFKIAQMMKADRVNITLGKKGSLAYSLRENKVCKIPAILTDSKDTVGTGDSYLSFTSPCALVGMPPDALGFIGSIVGSLASKIVCNERAVSVKEIKTFLRRFYDEHS